MQADSKKKTWSTPKLVVHGTLEKITKNIPPKKFGGSDGALFMGQSVMWGS